MPVFRFISKSLIRHNGLLFMVEKKYATLLEDKDVLRWYQNVSRGAQSTADVSLRGLGRFCSMTGISPHEVASMSEKQIVGLMLDYVTTLEKNGKTGSIH